MFTFNDNNANERLRRAVERADLESLDNAMKDGADVNCLHEDKLPGWKYRGRGDGNSALHIACWLGLHGLIVDRLIELGADLNLKSADGKYTPLHCASKSGNLDLVNLLLDQGCNPNAKDKDFTIPLSWASCHNSIKAIELLLDRGSNIHDKSNLGETAIIFACWSEHLEVVELLIHRGANVNDTDLSGESPLSFASRGGHKDMVNLLLSRGGDMHYKTRSGITPNLYSSLFGHAEIAVVFRNWPVTMTILVLQELYIFNQLDIMSFNDLFEYVGIEEDYL